MKKSLFKFNAGIYFNKFLLLFLMVQFVFSSTAYSYEIISYYHSIPQSSYTCENKICLTLDDAVDLAKKNSFLSREKVEELYRARQMIKVKLGAILPHLNFGTAFAGADMILGDYSNGLEGIISSFLGFLFPDRWFRWKESRFFYYSEKYSFLSLLSNQVNSTEGLYSAVQREYINSKILEFYMAKINHLVTMLETREINAEATPQQLADLKILRSRISSSSIMINRMLREILPQLAHAVAWNVVEDWNNFSIVPKPIPDLSHINPINGEEYFPEVVSKSYELKSLRFLKVAAKYSRRARMFEFLSPNATPDNSLGFGYPSYIRIGRSEERTVGIKLVEQESNLKRVLFASMANYNTALKLFHESLNGIESSQVRADGVFDDFSSTGLLRIERLAVVLEDALSFDLYKNAAEHYYLISEANIRRLLLQGKYYQGLESVIPARRRLERATDKISIREDEDIAKGPDRNLLEN